MTTTVRMVVVMAALALVLMVSAFFLGRATAQPDYNQQRAVACIQSGGNWNGMWCAR